MWNGVSFLVSGFFKGAAGRTEPEPAEVPARTFKDLIISEIDDVCGMLEDEYLFRREEVLEGGFDALRLHDTCRVELQGVKVMSVLRLRSKKF